MVAYACSLPNSHQDAISLCVKVLAYKTEHGRNLSHWIMIPIFSVGIQVAIGSKVLSLEAEQASVFKLKIILK
jgi:hypothetical protein